jgi:archaellum component FlaC
MTTDERLDGIDQRLHNMDSRLNNMDSRLNKIDSRLDGMELEFRGFGDKLNRIHDALKMFVNRSASVGSVSDRVDDHELRLQSLENKQGNNH